jgi:opacity protein-like surface antigen
MTSRTARWLETPHATILRRVIRKRMVFTMKKLVLVCAVFMAFSIAAGAQDYPKAEVFGGYSFVHFNVQETPSSDTAFNLNGGSASISFNPKAKLGLVADFGGYHGSPTVLGSSASVTQISYLFGPKVAMRSNARITPFGQALFGGVHQSTTITFQGIAPISVSSSANAFAMALGGGADAKVNKTIAIRVFQLEYMLTKFKDNFSNRQNGVRISTGIVFGFGG